MINRILNARLCLLDSRHVYNLCRSSIGMFQLISSSQHYISFLSFTMFHWGDVFNRRDNCHEIGYADHRSVKHSVSSEDETNTSAKSNSCSRFSSNVHTNSRNVHTTSRDAHTPSRDVPTTSRDVPTTSHDKSRSKCTGGEHKTGQVHSSIQATNQTMWRELSNRPTRQISTNLGVKVNANTPDHSKFF